ncbi:single-strand DNA-binding protein [Granulicatella balaenopterae]|uniref:Single-stranded DNA-binding protein n=1 Tax=Granulicatella balaenopterae TaxID=137733 RepID=A0A1H9NC94_9LACT|nr:single-stranded DNA-binding protein [Granulicatella balaenopterae]SER33518.1 single-strand DNA-binding protein [Granulicatella balaenopterae]
MINNVVLVGRLTRPVDLRYTGNGTAVGTFSLAVNRNFTNQQGERETDFINCVIWRKAAENFANFTRKGSLVGVEGRIQTRNYENAQGQRVYVTEILVENFSLLESRSVTEQRPIESGSTGNFGANQNFNQNQNQFNSFSNQSQTNNNSSQSTPNSSLNQFADPFMSNGETIDISDDDLPF